MRRKKREKKITHPLHLGRGKPENGKKSIHTVKRQIARD